MINPDAKTLFIQALDRALQSAYKNETDFRATFIFSGIISNPHTHDLINEAWVASIKVRDFLEEALRQSLREL